MCFIIFVPIMKNITLILLVSLLIISCEKDNGGSSSNGSNSKDTTKQTTVSSLLNPPEKYWGDYYSKNQWGNYYLRVTISKDDVVYDKESLTLKYKNHGLSESIGNQYVLTTTFSASPMLGDFHKYTIWTMNDSMINFHAKQRGTSKWELIKR